MNEKDTRADAAHETSNDAALSISADAVAAAMDRLIDDGRLEAQDKGLILWLFGDAKAKGQSYSDVGKAIGYDASTVSRLFRGRYEGSLDKVLVAIRRYKHLLDERGRMIRPDFVETSIWQSIRATCDLALIHQMPALIIGVSQIGKTTAVLEYQRRSEYLVRYVRMPAAPGFRGAMEAFADACFVTTKCTSEQLRRRVAKSLDSKTLLIVDELHQLAISAGKNAAMKIMEWIRELHDVSGCGLVCVGTKAVDQDLLGGELKGWLDQFQQRCIKRLELPDRLPDADIVKIVTAYGLPRPDSATLELLRTLRCNKLCKTLMLAGNLAQKRGVELDWPVFTQTWNTVSK